MCDISQSSLGFVISVRLKAICMAYEMTCDTLRTILPDIIRDTTFSSCLHEDTTMRRLLERLLHNFSGIRVALQAGGFDHMLVN
ncbi:hypothetical protein T459_01772 [Capsicum annuum]|uniref:Uncharacterized protein n=1 Tax=Capsicum annuum TaxID=4072 RepID=A0A2G3AI66_CAPAN|nr:hypothetical protein T459_01772 [Capsicum annuum]